MKFKDKKEVHEMKDNTYCVKEAAKKCEQKIINEQIDLQSINYYEDNNEAGKLEGIKIAVEEAFLAGVEWAKNKNNEDER